MTLTPAERRIVRLVAAVQFVNILDFMMVMPMAPDFTAALGIPTGDIGYVGGAYTAAACIAGLAGTLFLDRFDRRNALAVAVLGLVAATAAGGAAVSFGTLIAARVMAGAFGGPATSIAMAIVADTVAPERRGRAMATTAAAFSAASVFGVPLGLELARLGGWRTPFFTVAGLGALVLLFVFRHMPVQRTHLVLAAQGPGEHPFRTMGRLLRTRSTQLSALLIALSIGSQFIIVPNMSAYFVYNLGFPRDRLGLVYMLGGSVAFFVTRVIGSAADRFGATAVATVATLFSVAVTLMLYVVPRPPVSIYALFAGAMVFNACRQIVVTTTTSRVPAPAERARFMSLCSATQHIASSLAAFVAAELLATAPGGALVGMPRVAMVSIALSALVPLILRALERRVVGNAPSRRVAGALASGDHATATAGPATIR